jgi:hypothetical protein
MIRFALHDLEECSIDGLHCCLCPLGCAHAVKCTRAASPRSSGAACRLASGGELEHAQLSAVAVVVEPGRCAIANVGVERAWLLRDRFASSVPAAGKGVATPAVPQCTRSGPSDRPGPRRGHLAGPPAERPPTRARRGDRPRARRAGVPGPAAIAGAAVAGVIAGRPVGRAFRRGRADLPCGVAWAPRPRRGLQLATWVQRAPGLRVGSEI